MPYNPYLLKKYDAHINVEIAKGVHATKYLVKYVNKGIDRATLAIGDRSVEISDFAGEIHQLYRSSSSAYGVSYSSGKTSGHDLTISS